jgi:hypothetical protein
MQSAHEQWFLREGGLGTITSVLDVPCGSIHHRDEGARRHTLSIRSCCSADECRIGGGGNGDGDGDGDGTNSVAHACETRSKARNSKSSTNPTTFDVAIFR